MHSLIVLAHLPPNNTPKTWCLRRLSDLVDGYHGSGGTECYKCYVLDGAHVDLTFGIENRVLK